MRERRIYVYKCVVDDGGAPCVEDGLLSLTICKPYVRRTARKGDLIFAFGSNNESPGNRLVYIAEVSERLTSGRYFEVDRYQTRADCIYERQPSRRLARRASARFHDYPAARISDLGDEPDYPNANALVAEEFRYFGRRGMDVWKATAPNLRELIEGLGQGHRVNFSSQLMTELLTLRNQIWQNNPNRKVLGKPLHAPDEQKDSESDELVKVCKTRCYYIPKPKKC